MAGNFSLPTVLANLTAGNQALSLIDGDLTTLRDPLLALSTFANYYTDTGSANTYSCTVSSPQTVSLAAGLRVEFLPTNANTGASTFQINALTVKNIFLNGAALVGGEIKAAVPIVLLYDGTQWNIVGNSAASFVPRSYLAGLTLSTAGASTTMTTAAGMATDAANAYMMKLTSSVAKTTSAWAVGTGNGGLDTGAIANSTWYHFYLIQRLDTSVVDVLFSLSATAPTMPTNYGLKRRIGSGLTSGAAQWVAFIQDGDYFRWLASVLDINANNPGTAAVTRTLASVPTGVNVFAQFNANINSTTPQAATVIFSDLSANDEAPSVTVAPLSMLSQPITTLVDQFGTFSVRTNTSAQIRSRISLSDANTNLRIATTGWIDRRGRDT
jgi:hypothetical protein